MQFHQLIGQENVIAKVKEAVAEERLPHALLLTGAQGIGKLAMATAIAQYLNCLNPSPEDSCGKCANCLKIQKLVHPDLRFILPILSKKEKGKTLLSQDFMAQFREQFLTNPYLGMGSWQESLGADNKQLFISVHEIRELKRSIYLKAFEAEYKVTIVWEADRINTQGANAFLKLLEEPPEKTVFILTTSRPERLLLTIRSRCQVLPLKRIAPDAIQRYLETHRQLPTQQAAELAAISEGSLGNAENYLGEQYQSMSKRYQEWLRAVYSGRYERMSQQNAFIYKESTEIQKMFLLLAMKKIRDSLLVNLSIDHLALMTPEEQTFQAKFAPFATPRRVERISTALQEALKAISGNASAQMVFSSLALKAHQILHS